MATFNAPVASFQTRNPLHRAHESLRTRALESADGLPIDPLIGDTKEGDTPADVRMACYEALLDEFCPKDRVALGTFSIPMRYAGQHETVHRAVCRQSCGCTHISIGRAHAGVGSCYGTCDAQRTSHRFGRRGLEIEPLEFEHALFCPRCGQVVSRKTCPHDGENPNSLSGTMVREIPKAGEDLPVESARLGIAEILRRSVGR